MKSFASAKVNVKPIFANLVHTDSYEGPCRTGRTEDLTPEADRQGGREGFKKFEKHLRDNAAPHVKVLEPSFVERTDDFVIHEAELKKLEPDIYEADLVLISGSGLRQIPAITIATRYQKPVGQFGWVSSVDIAANLRSRGFEGYAFLDYDHFNHFTHLLRVRKAFRQMRMMLVTQGNSFPSVGVVSSIVDLEGLQQRFGVGHTLVSASQIVQAMDNPPAKADQEAQELTDKLIGNAEASHMQRENILPSVVFFVTVKRFLEQYECNAFAIPCFEICVTKTMAERRVMFCLAHTLLKDMGIPSACEADTNVLMAIALLTYLSEKSVFMGNSSEQDRKHNILRVHHDVPGLQMKGFEQPPLPYELRNFTVGGWGATVRYDFNRDKGEPVTLARFNPAGDKVLIATGTIAGGNGVDRIGCSLGLNVKINDIVDFFEKEQDFGHHLAVVYGDYTADIRRLSKIMGFEVIAS